MAAEAGSGPEVGGFDEAYFMYVEDVDFCWRLRRAGYRVVYDPSMRLLHHIGRTSSQQSGACSTTITQHVHLFPQASGGGVASCSSRGGGGAGGEVCPLPPDRKDKVRKGKEGKGLILLRALALAAFLFIPGWLAFSLLRGDKGDVNGGERLFLAASLGVGTVSFCSLILALT